MSRLTVLQAHFESRSVNGYEAAGVVTNVEHPTFTTIWDYPSNNKKGTLSWAENWFKQWNLKYPQIYIDKIVFLNNLQDLGGTACPD